MPQWTRLPPVSALRVHDGDRVIPHRDDPTYLIQPQSTCVLKFVHVQLLVPWLTLRSGTAIDVPPRAYTGPGPMLLYDLNRSYEYCIIPCNGFVDRYPVPSS